MLTSLALIVLIAVVVSYRNALRSLHQRMDLTETSLSHPRGTGVRARHASEPTPACRAPAKGRATTAPHATAQIPACRTATERSATD